MPLQLFLWYCLKQTLNLHSGSLHSACEKKVPLRTHLCTNWIYSRRITHWFVRNGVVPHVTLWRGGGDWHYQRDWITGNTSTTCATSISGLPPALVDYHQLYWITTFTWLSTTGLLALPLLFVLPAVLDFHPYLFNIKHEHDVIMM